ncbi:hypothetical protein M0R45_007329 [Rubus argutus]|uniref:Lipoprotein n=1 Tax=Rubus argutus TaxID=59490 RepID=A0AAW1Y1B7_RUBAR
MKPSFKSHKYLKTIFKFLLLSCCSLPKPPDSSNKNQVGIEFAPAAALYFRLGDNFNFASPLETINPNRALEPGLGYDETPQVYVIIYRFIPELSSTNKLTGQSLARSHDYMKVPTSKPSCDLKYYPAMSFITLF